MRPFLKWAGGKTRLVERIRARLPGGRRLVEPFVGSGAVWLNTDYPEALLADVNPDLIRLYATLQRHGEDFIQYCAQFFVSPNNTAERYYALREAFNHSTEDWEKSALFLYLNRHGYNGLCRYNAKGRFNVPFGRYAHPYFPKAEMQHFYHKSQTATFVCADFRTVMEGLGPGDVVYCDPPYVPLSRTANFTDYAAGGFGPREQEALARLAARLGREGVPVLISNHATDFTRGVYAGADLDVFDVQRLISCDGANRRQAREILALFR
ncbi:MAG: Dam family site-specific DNA-(adenine-N6)-methyltransferase [Firmicutes bacterium]|nr:Dam family site-specific DNA-(adenine-N6)-methyltransferase [Bacillota bacterium]